MLAALFNKNRATELSCTTLGPRQAFGKNSDQPAPLQVIGTTTPVKKGERTDVDVGVEPVVESIRCQERVAGDNEAAIVHSREPTEVSSPQYGQVTAEFRKFPQLAQLNSSQCEEVSISKSLSLPKSAKVLRFSTVESSLIANSLRDALQETCGDIPLDEVDEKFLATKRHLFLDTLFNVRGATSLPPKYECGADRSIFSASETENITRNYHEIICRLENLWDKLQ